MSDKKGPGRGRPARGGSPPSRSARGAPVKGGAAPNPHRQKAEELIRTSGLPRPMAFQVAMGQLSLNDALQRLASEDRARALSEKHGLDHGLAVQVAVGHADLEAVLAKKRLQHHLGLHRFRSVLVGAPGGAEPALELCLHGRRRASGTVVAVDRYEFDLRGADGAVERIHKLQAKLAWRSADHDEVRRCVLTDPALERDAEPLPRPQDRAPLPDRGLFALLEAGVAVRATTLEGEVAHGVIHWIGRWEIGLVALRPGRKPKGKDLEGPELVLFRHALTDLRSA